jgi:hypothetical protein
MTVASDRTSRRAFLVDAGLVGGATLLTACAGSAQATLPGPRAVEPRPAVGEWDLSWTARVAAASDRAVFDMPGMEDPASPGVPEIAGRYLDNCIAVYGPHGADAIAVLNIRTRAVPMALSDAAWERFALGVEYTVTDPVTKQPAVRNPFWHRTAGAPLYPQVPSLEEFVQRGAILLVCDFALGHLSARLATKAGRSADDVHRELRGSFVPGAVAVPSGMFGLARSQNAGCAYVHV